MQTSKITGILIILFSLIVSCLLTGSLMLYFDVKSILIVFGLLLGGIVFSSGIIVPLKAVKNAFDSNSANSPEELKQFIYFFNSASRLSIGAGVIGIFIGIIGILAVLNDPSQIGANAAIALLTAFYGVILSELVFQPMKNSVIKKFPVDIE